MLKPFSGETNTETNIKEHLLHWSSFISTQQLKSFSLDRTTKLIKVKKEKKILSIFSEDMTERKKRNKKFTITQII